MSGSYYSFKTASTDSNVLKLLNYTTNKSMIMLGLSMDERFEQYINDGTYETLLKKQKYSDASDTLEKFRRRNSYNTT